MLSTNRSSATRRRRGLLPAIVLALFLLLVARPGPAAALGGAPPVPPQVLDTGSSHTCAHFDSIPSRVGLSGREWALMARKSMGASGHPRP